jgi:hypothetical protein
MQTYDVGTTLPLLSVGYQILCVSVCVCVYMCVVARNMRICVMLSLGFGNYKHHHATWCNSSENHELYDVYQISLLHEILRKLYKH